MTNQELFDKRINGKLPVLVDFYTSQDATSRMMNTLLKIVVYRLEGKIKMIRVDINANNNQEIINQHLQQKMSTFSLFYQGELQWQGTGFFTSRRLIDIIKDQLLKLQPYTEIE
ncbi:MAG: thioredoxin family protein [Saprospiraceae bacterium]